MDRSVPTAFLAGLALVLASCTGPADEPDRDGAPRAQLSAVENGGARLLPLRSWSGTVRSSADDAEQRASGRTVLRSDALELTRDGSRQRIGLRFTGVRVPRGAIIERAWVQFTTAVPTRTVTQLRIRAQASDDASRFRSRAFDIGRRATVQGRVVWKPGPWPKAGARGVRQRTPNVQRLVQRVVNRPGWRPGNAVALVVSGSGRRVAASYESRRRAPVLHIAYEPPPPKVFTFAAAGDLGAGARTTASLRLLDGSGASFFLALGDLRYGRLSSDAAWCDFVVERLPRKGPRFPIELVVGNHEETGSPDGNILNFVNCFPDRLGARTGSTGRYGAQYSIDYPSARPLARFVMIAPNLRVGQTRYSYEAGSPHRAWLVRQIDSAREQGIPWVVVGLHFPCITAGAGHGCDSGEDVLNLLVGKQVDLVLTGHNHVYERSKQLHLNGATCPALREDAPDTDCVTDTGEDGAYDKGAGTVLVTAGSFGAALQGIDETDPDLAYYAAYDEKGYGFVSYRVDRDRIRARFLPSSGTFADSFTITR